MDAKIITDICQVVIAFCAVVIAVIALVVSIKSAKAAVAAQAQELIALAEKKSALRWKVRGIMSQSCVFALAGKTSDAIRLITSAMAAYRSTGSTIWTPFYLSRLAWAYVGPGQFDDAARRIGEALTAVETTKEGLCEAEVHRTAGEIALMAPEPEVAKAEGHFEHALAVAREQQAKSWELRAAMSMARLWRDQGK